MRIIKQFKNGQIAVNCQTREEAQSFIKLCFDKGMKWSDGNGCDVLKYDYHKEETYYAIYNGSLGYGCIHINAPNYQIVTFETFMNIYTKEEENKMCSNGKLNKGIEGTLVQDVYRAVQNKNGDIVFNKVKMVNLCFVKFDGNEKVYTFKNPSDKRLEKGTKVLVDTCRGEMEATVLTSIKIQNKYVNELQYAMTGYYDLGLKNILGVYETKTVATKVFTKLGE